MGEVVQRLVHVELPSEYRDEVAFRHSRTVGWIRAGADHWTVRVKRASTLVDGTFRRVGEEYFLLEDGAWTRVGGDWRDAVVQVLRRADERRMI